MKRIRRLVRPRLESTETLPYRGMLFNELLSVSSISFLGGRILEIGPKDGLDSLRLAELCPAELVFIELPEKRQQVDKWFGSISGPKRYVEGNLMYLDKKLFASLGSFKLIWCTGVLYHNAEQLKFLRKISNLLEIGGYLVLETATLRATKALRDASIVEVHWPNTYRDTGTITHLPSIGAVKAWLDMVGFSEITDSKCYTAYNTDLVDQRFACIARKTSDGRAYYNKSGLNPDYILGDSL